LGEEALGALAREYLAAHPFFSGAGEDLAETLPGFLSVALEEDEARGPWMVDLARLERAVDEVRAAPARPALSPVVLWAHDMDKLPEHRLIAVPGVRLLALDHEVDGVYQSLLERRPWAAPLESEQHLVVYRRNDEIRRMRLAPAAAAFLRGLLGGARIGDAMAQARFEAADEGWSPRAFARRCALWLRLWLDEGLFGALVGPPPAEAPAPLAAMTGA
jgi:hypothetical protein